ncbi:MAG: AtpZ/AtpI family protein [Bacteroidota bacterium]|nr:AtpZ/AtpI family protein [Bacteroidota bacterium]MEC8637360.1 AtpZ/AtpI family protein [Bacteroidota bacterium]
MKKNPKKPRKPNPFRWLALSGFGIQLGITIYVFIRLGQWLDRTYNADRTFTLICVLVGLFVSLIILLQQLKKLNND